MPTIYPDTNIIAYLQEPAAYQDQEWYPALSTIQRYLALPGNNAKVTYSPAHLSDLRQGYKKDPARAMEKLAFLSRLTHDQCLSKYIGSTEAIFENRVPAEFFLTNPDTDDGFYRNNTDKPNLLTAMLSEGRLEGYKDQYFDYAAAEPLLKASGVDFKRSQKDPTRYSLTLDLIENLPALMNETAGYNLVRALRDKVRPETGVADKIRGSADPLTLLTELLPQTVTGARLSGMISPESHHTDDREALIRNCFMNLDLLGFASDKLNKDHTLSTTTADVAHTYYASHCDIFVTSDTKTGEKAAAVFRHLKINSQVFDLAGFAAWALKNS